MGNLTIARGRWAEALAALSHVIDPRRSILAELLCARLWSENGLLYLSGTDLDIELCVRLGPGETGPMLLPFGVLRELRRRPDFIERMGRQESPIIERQETVVLHWLGLRLRLEPAPIVEDYPVFPWPSDGVGARFVIGSSELKAALQVVRHAISADQTRYYLHGVYLHGAEDKKLAVVATDGHRLCKVDLPRPADCPDSLGVIVPTDVVSLLLGTLPECEVVTVSIAGMRAQFEWHGVRLRCKLIDGTYPPYRKVFPPSFTHELRLDPGIAGTLSLFQALETRRREEIEDEDDEEFSAEKWVRDPVYVKFEDGAGACKLTAWSAGPSPTPTMETPAPSVGTIASGLVLNRRQIADAVDSFAGAAVELLTNGPLEPVMIRSPQYPDIVEVVMPIVKNTVPNA